MISVTELAPVVLSLTTKCKLVLSLQPEFDTFQGPGPPSIPLLPTNIIRKCESFPTHHDVSLPGKGIQLDFAQTSACVWDGKFQRTKFFLLTLLGASVSVIADADQPFRFHTVALSMAYRLAKQDVDLGRYVVCKQDHRKSLTYAILAWPTYLLVVHRVFLDDMRHSISLITKPGVKASHKG